MTIFQLECFCALADSLNFTQTANAMFITQPALSRAISSLEQELQLTLLQRTTHSVTLTPAGKIFSSRALFSSLTLSGSSSRVISVWLRRNRFTKSTM